MRINHNCCIKLVRLVIYILYIYIYSYGEFIVGRDSAAAIATRYGLDSPEIESRCGARYSAPVQTGPGAHPASCTMGIGSFRGLKRPERGVDHPPHLLPMLKKE